MLPDQLYLPKPSVEVSRYRFRPLPPDPYEKAKQEARSFEIYLDSKRSASYESVTGTSLLRCEVPSSSFYAETELSQDLDRLSRSDYFDTIAGRGQMSSCKPDRQSLLPAPIIYRSNREPVISTECRLSDAPDPRYISKPSDTPTYLNELSSRLGKSAQRDSLSSSEAPSTLVPSLCHTLSLHSLVDVTPTSRNSTETITLVTDTPSPISKRRSKPKAIWTVAGARNISPPMESPLMSNAGFGFSMSPGAVTSGSIEVSYQPSRAAPAAPTPVFETSGFYPDDDDEDKPKLLTRAKKSFSDLKATRSRTDLTCGRTQKKTTFAEPFPDASHPSPPLPQINLKQRTSAPLPKPNTSNTTSATNFSRNAIGHASMRSRSPAKLSKKLSVKHTTRQRAGTRSSQASTAGNTSTSTSATLVGTQSPTPVMTPKKRFSLAVSSKSWKSRRPAGVGRFKRWAWKVLKR